MTLSPNGQPENRNIIPVFENRIRRKICPIEQISAAFSVAVKQIMFVFKIDPKGDREAKMILGPVNKGCKFCSGRFRDILIESKVKPAGNMGSRLDIDLTGPVPQCVFKHMDRLRFQYSRKGRDMQGSAIRFETEKNRTGRTDSFRCGECVSVRKTRSIQ